jgi:uncharacterized protein
MSLPIWWKVRMRRGTHRGSSMGEDFLADSRSHPLDDAYWAAKRPDLSAIDAPALVGASWSDQGLHTRGSLLAYEQLRGPKWLVVHGRRKWETYYSAEALELQRRFLDHFLKGASIGWADEPAVRYELRHTRTSYMVRTSTHWPLPHATPQTLYLDAASMTLAAQPNPLAHKASYSAVPRRRHPDRVRFTHRFTECAEITGSMALTVWMSIDEGIDLDVFVVVRKRSPAGAVVPFYGYNGYINDGVAKGWLRGSHRELDEKRSRPERPFHTHRTVEPLNTGEPTQMTVEIWPSSTHFEAGSELVIEIVGHDADRYPVLRHNAVINRGIHTIHTGATTPSTLAVPLIPAPIVASQSVTVIE